jgi:catechol 2,3-dioxygenase-like lactoylglutathione lyase family enzyme
MPDSDILGIHHVTAIASDPQRNLEFYSGVLGLRLVKRTVNFDDPSTYHLYYGDEVGSPGSLMTFFPWPGAYRGQRGVGQAAVTAFSVLPSAIGFWMERLVRLGVEHDAMVKRGPEGDQERVIALRDQDGTALEIVGHAAAEGRRPWGRAPGVSEEHAIRGFHSVTLWVDAHEPTERVLVDSLGFEPQRDDETTRRYIVGTGAPGCIVDVRAVGGFLAATSGAGTVHHVAFEVESDTSELAVRERLERAGLLPTPVIDRTYFHSVYFSEPGGVLFELATSSPGFLVDEPIERLGERLMLPPQYEPGRAAIERALPPLSSEKLGPETSAFADRPDSSLESPGP